MYLLGFHAYINKMHGSRSKIPSKKSHPYKYNVKFLALLGAPYIYNISRLRVNSLYMFTCFEHFFAQLLAGSGWNSNPASSHPTQYTQNIQIAVYTLPPDDMQISTRNMYRLLIVIN
jgi:hypothetical protein